VQREHLTDEETPRVDSRHSVEVGALEELERRPPVLHLPYDIRQEDQRGQPGGVPGPARGQQFPFVGEHEPREEPRAQEHHGVLVHEPEAERQPQPEPVARFGLPEQANEQVERERPDQMVEDVGR